MKVLILQGLPASGKSTYARQLVDTGQYVRVNKDDMRALYHNGKHSKGRESFVINMRNTAILAALTAGQSVVVDDTNLNPIHEQTIRALVHDWNLTAKTAVDVETKFFDTPLETCIARDLQRAASVGERVIRGMYTQYLAPQPARYIPPENAPQAILCDIDGTLAHMDTRSPYDWERVGEDTLDMTVASILDVYHQRGVKIVLLSGRDGICRPHTEAWLRRWQVPYDSLYMRTPHDNRKDTLIKQELFESHIRATYHVLFVLDDRNQVVEMWRGLGLKTLQVAAGDF